MTAVKTLLVKWIHALSNFIAIIPTHSICQVIKDIVQVQKEKRIVPIVFTSYTKREIRKFHVVVV